MIDFIYGEIVNIEDDGIVLLNNNIGYFIKMPGRDLSSLKIGIERKIYTRMVVREDDISLFGFNESDSRILFDILTTVSGIGPKVGLGVLSTLSNTEIRSAILTEDSKILTKGPGIGKKTAERIILELKDKISKVEFNDNIEIHQVVEDNEICDSEALEALVSLGYNKYEAKEALSKVDDGLGLSQKIKEALKGLGR